MKKTLLIIGGFFASIIYLAFLINLKVISIELLPFVGYNKNLGLVLPIFIIGPLIGYLLSKKGWRSYVFIFFIIAIFAYIPVKYLIDQKQIKEEEEIRLTQNLEWQEEAQQAAVKRFPSKITNIEVEGGPWGECSTILVEITGDNIIGWYNYEVNREVIIEEVDSVLLSKYISHYINDSKVIEVLPGSGSREIIFYFQGKEGRIKGKAILGEGCNLVLDRIILESKIIKVNKKLYTPL